MSKLEKNGNSEQNHQASPVLNLMNKTRKKIGTIFTKNKNRSSIDQLDNQNTIRKLHEEYSNPLGITKLDLVNGNEYTQDDLLELFESIDIEKTKKYKECAEIDDINFIKKTSGIPIEILLNFDRPIIIETDNSIYELEYKGNKSDLDNKVRRKVFKATTKKQGNIAGNKIDYQEPIGIAEARLSYSKKMGGICLNLKLLNENLEPNKDERQTTSIKSIK